MSTVLLVSEDVCLILNYPVCYSQSLKYSCHLLSSSDLEILKGGRGSLGGLNIEHFQVFFGIFKRSDMFYFVAY
jgi:hypothetical protein